jgi:multidrug efflux pump subunit AcrA (membrane-fusion protein)
MTRPVGSKRLWVRRGIPVVVVALVVAGVAGTRAFASGEATPSYRLGTVAKGSVDQTLTLSGTVRKASQTTSAFKVSGTVKSVKVGVGDEVNAGETLATLDPTALQRTVTSARATLAQAQATLASDEGAATSVDYDTFTTSSAEVFAIQTALVRATTPPTTPAGAAAAVAKVQAQVSAAQTTAKTALAALASAQDAQTTACATVVAGTATPSEVAGCVTAITTTLTAQAAAGSAQSDLTAAQGALGTALRNQATVLASSASGGSNGNGSNGNGSNGNGSKGTGSGSTGSGSTGSAGRGGSGGSGSAGSAQRIASDKAAVTTAKAALTTALTNLGDAILTAPISGTVAELGYTPGAASGSNTVTIVGAGAVDVTVDVPLASLPSVKAGQAAEVLPTGFSTPVAGSVRSISLLPASSTSTSVTYPVVVRVPEPTPALASGSSATATITLQSVTNVLTVPNSAVTRLVSGSGFVLTVKNGTATRTLVRTGAVGSTRTQVLSGLTQGQQVVLADLSQALPTNSTFGNRFGNRSGTGLTSSLSGTGGFGGGFSGGGSGPRVFVGAPAG